MSGSLITTPATSEKSPRRIAAVNTFACATVSGDIWFGSSGSLLPGVKARLVTVEGNEITGYDQPGELWVNSPSVTLGYLKNEQATKETFVEEQDGRYMRTGDEAVCVTAVNVGPGALGGLGCAAA